MNRKIIKYQTHCQAKALTIANPSYRQWVFQYTFAELEKDKGKGDLTTNTFFVQDKKTEAMIIAKEKGIFAGRQEIEFFLKKFKNISFLFLKKDGKGLKKNDVILKLNGSIFELMKLERIILNFLGRMSGVATKTQKTVNKAKKVNSQVLITPTRKTLWGLLDKRACVIGGGGTHRLSLNNAVLIKHNHIKASGLNLEDFLHKVLKSRQIHRGKFVEIEVSNSKDAIKATEIFSFAKKQGVSLPCFIMFDNMTAQKIQQTLAIIKQKGFYKDILFEASGGISEKNIAAYARTGVDIVSMGAITHSAPMLDLSMRVMYPSNANAHGK